MSFFWKCEWKNVLFLSIVQASLKETTTATQQPFLLHIFFAISHRDKNLIKSVYLRLDKCALFRINGEKR